MSTSYRKHEAQKPSGLFVSYTLARASQALLDLVFPPRCAGCGRVDHAWCPRCADALSTTPLDVQTEHAFDTLMVASTGPHTGWLQSAVQGLKYDGVRTLAAPLADRLEAAINQVGWSADLIVPVPMHANRLAQRGYNQAALLAEAFASKSPGRALRTDVLERRHDTRSQVGLGYHERLHNVQGAFLATTSLDGRAVILVDDVFTTGATLVGCARALIEAGARVVYGLTVSTAVHTGDTPLTAVAAHQ